MEAFALRLPGVFARADHFQCQDAVEAFLPCLVNDSHAAAADLPEQLVIVELNLRKKWLGGVDGLFEDFISPAQHLERQA